MATSRQRSSNSTKPQRKNDKRVEVPRSRRERICTTHARYDSSQHFKHSNESAKLPPEGRYGSSIMGAPPARTTTSLEQFPHCRLTSTSSLNPQQSPRHSARLEVTHWSGYRARNHLTYHTWVFSEHAFLSELAELGYEIILQWEVPEDRPVLDGRRRPNVGMLLQR